METRRHFVSNGDGWRISLNQSWDPDKLDRTRNPVVIVPGYGMNSFIFGFHPRGLSLEGYLANEGFEVWRVDLRAQGESVSEGGSDNFSLGDLAATDLGAAMDCIVARNHGRAERVDVIGASLGGTIMFAHIAMNPNHKMGALISIGGPVRWVRVHPVLRLLFGSPKFAGWLRFRGTRRMAETMLPLITRHAPWVLSIYLNPSITDVSAAREMVKTVEDPNRFINKEIAVWIQKKDLIVRGVNVSSALSSIDQPLFCVLANADGIVPRETAIFPYEQVRSKVRAMLEVGDAATAVAHADLFICNEAHERVFRPLATWLLEQNQTGANGNSHRRAIA